MSTIPERKGCAYLKLKGRRAGDYCARPIHECSDTKSYCFCHAPLGEGWKRVKKWKLTSWGETRRDWMNEVRDWKS